MKKMIILYVDEERNVQECHTEDPIFIDMLLATKPIDLWSKWRKLSDTGIQAMLSGLTED